MKSMKWIVTSALAFLVVCSSNAQVQSRREVIRKAMKDELNRNMSRLVIGDLKKPFFISYTIKDARRMSISASLGALVSSNESNGLYHNVRVLVGDYKRDNENFEGSFSFDNNSVLNYAELPNEPDYFSIRRALWIATDNAYKDAAVSYEKKLAALAQLKQSVEEAALDDFSKTTPTTLMLPQRTFDFMRSQWEQNARRLSSLFAKYPDIHLSKVSITAYQEDVFFISSEGTETVYPVTLVSLQVTASTQADDGTYLNDGLSFYGVTIDDFPTVDAIGKDIESMASLLAAKRVAPEMDDNYTGPVLFEEQASGELIASSFFRSNGLVAKRKPVIGGRSGITLGGMHNIKSFENNIGTRILPKCFSISSVPAMTKSGTCNLIGSYEIDAEGVAPPKELPLVEDGMLKTLMSDRIPSPKINASNGHCRLPVGMNVSASTGPGVVLVKNTDGISSSEMKEELLTRAKEAGLPYAVIVRKLNQSSGNIMVPGNSMYPSAVYKVNVSDGKETLVRSVELGAVSPGCLRRIPASGKEQFIYNTLLSANVFGSIRIVLDMFISSTGSSSSTGIPVTFIVPRSILIDEMEIQKESSDYTPKPPVVPSPLSAK
jgi:hypothetical protein